MLDRRSHRRPLRSSVHVLALLVPLAVTSAVAVACADGERRACRVGADCASGMCGSDGLCVEGPTVAPTTSPTPDDGGIDDAAGGSTVDAEEPRTPDDGGGIALPGCVPNKDGTITRDEVPMRAGLRATFRVAEDVEVSTAGEPLGDGRRRWDLSMMLPNDAHVLVETLPLTGKWYASKFAGASYATQLRKSSDLVGVFEAAPGALTLMGVVSPSDGLYKTELTNDPPVSMLEFPLTLDKKWHSDTTVTGWALGALTTYTEKYTAHVDAAGELVTPLGTFDVLRVRIDLERVIGLYKTTSRTFAFITECYGNVASIVSKDDERDVEFTRAAEVRRISP